MKEWKNLWLMLGDICVRLGQTSFHSFSTHTLRPLKVACLVLTAAVVFPGNLALAYPPAPYHMIYGIVRDEMGNPLVITNAEIVLHTLSGVEIKARLVPSLAPGMNYRLLVPMDAGLTADAYKPTALRPTVPFRLRVNIRQAVYLPIEATANFANLGHPAQRTRLDLTLGEDSNGNGLPDAWERALAAALGGNPALEDLLPEADADGDGISNLDEYLAGTYAFDPADGFRLGIVKLHNTNPVLEFLAIRGRSYSIEASTDPDLAQWTPVSFRLLSESPDASIRQTYPATDVRICSIELVGPEALLAPGVFYRAKVE